MIRVAVALLALALLSACASAPKRDLQLERLQASLANLETDPSLGELAAAERLQARQALERLSASRGDDRNLDLYVAERRVEIARTMAQAAPSQTIRTFGALRLDPDARRVWREGTELELTRTEFDLLDVLTAHPTRAYSRRQLIDAVWGSDWYGDEHIVDVHVGHLRKKLNDDAASPRFIRTVRGVGYGMAS